MPNKRFNMAKTTVMNLDLQRFLTEILEATKALKSQTQKKIPAERFLLIWYPRGPTYDQKKTKTSDRYQHVFSLLFKYI